MAKVRIRKQDTEFVLGLEDNAMDSLIHAVEHYVEGRKPTDLKYTILHVFHALELFLKARLAQAHPILIYDRPENAADDAKTADFSTIVLRLKRVGVDINKQQVDDLEALRKARNSIEHHKINARLDDITTYVGRAMRFLEGFLRRKMSIV